jgi:hypothetical protein
MHWLQSVAEAYLTVIWLSIFEGARSMHWALGRCWWLICVLPGCRALLMARRREAVSSVTSVFSGQPPNNKLLSQGGAKADDADPARVRWLDTAGDHFC